MPAKIHDVYLDPITSELSFERNSKTSVLVGSTEHSLEECLEAWIKLEKEMKNESQNFETA
jgi:hypothetical protein